MNFGSEYFMLVQIQFNAISRFGDSAMNLNFPGFAFIPLLPNQSVVVVE